MDFGLAFSFPFKDPDWFKKIGIVSLVGLIPIIGQLTVLGWGFEITRRVIRGEFQPLPELDFGENLGKGFQVWLIGLVYAIPIFVITVPLGVLDALGTNAMNNSQDAASLLAVIVSVCFGGLMFVYSIALAFLLPAAIGRFADKGNIGDAFQFREVFALVRNEPVAYLLVLLGILLAGFIGPLGFLLCLVGVILTATYVQVVIAHLTGQAYRQAAR